MSDLLTFAMASFTAFFAIMNPIANTPIFLGLVEGMSQEKQKKVAKQACITAFLIVAIFVLLGKGIFDLFDITIPAFKITGGILIFVVGFEMLMKQKTKVHRTGEEEEDTDDNVAVSPLAIPILAGPGTIVTAMNQVTDGSIRHIFIVLAMFAVIILLTYLAFRLSNQIVEKIGQNMIAVISKLMGLILAIIGTGMVTAGIKLSM